MFHSKDKILVVSIVTLTLTGVVMVASSSYLWALMKYNDAYHFISRQILFSIIGFAVFLITSRISMRFIRQYNRIWLVLCFLTLLFVLIPGVGMARNGSRSWFGVGVFSIQPSEFFKLACIFTMADILAMRDRLTTLKDVFLPLIIPFIGFMLILLQPDFGSGLVMVCSIIVMVIVAGAPMKYFVQLAIVGGGGLLGLILAAPYRLARIIAFLDPWSDPLGSGFQIIQSFYAIAPGGLLGVGINQSMQKHYYLPEPQTDFIFAICAEELGWIGASLIILVYIIVFLECVKLAKECKDKYCCYVIIGITSLFVIQVLINLGVVVGLFPVTGVTYNS